MSNQAEPLARRALVAGGTGLVGGELLRRLRDDTRYSHVTSLGRRPVDDAGKVEHRVVSFDHLEQSEMPMADDAFCCLGTTRRKAGSDAAFRHIDFDYVLAYAQAARRAGAVRFLLVSSVGANADSSLLYPRVKGEVETAVQGLGFSVVGILRPSFLVGARAEARAGEAMAIKMAHLVGPLMQGPLRQYRPIEARTVAEGLVHLAFSAPPGVTVLSSEQIAASSERP